MGKSYTMPYEVAYYDGDITKRMTLPSMLAVVIKTSEEQSALLGRGAEFVAGFGLGWVITNYEIEIKRLPMVGENIQITTQAMSYNKYFCYRNFWIHDEAGEECVQIKSTFVLMNKKNRKMSNVLEEIIAPYESEKIKKIYRNEKIEKIESGVFHNYRVRFFDIDGNQHVNNAIYFNWLLDVLGYEFLSKHQPLRVNVKFDKEVEYGHEVESHYEVLENETGPWTRHEIRIEDQLYCEANIQWI
ncbi:acyl-[acyl-carrier-protein] thioesterase [Enterococcus sp. BWB1-3]|uniref:acyl-ACP thioesterase domain-containing protein n=1 Tax=unclassified Enterococcus TaxID=2608891 RepID=UPI001923B104|nr:MULTISPECIES: acyl-ACP thioesterase domain-containing protein [unclassified Enterococcus]MBL1228867.1 acyl-[acyl-carrier-protein] thioesterase [Enterococcus sp. BWB1-3]MCB5954682.1 acyl-[acyl-carrier-protein] thioesterase [Enterococcus sp. CWB-B31]